jgi:hypothetical protein
MHMLSLGLAALGSTGFVQDANLVPSALEGRDSFHHQIASPITFNG